MWSKLCDTFWHHPKTRAAKWDELGVWCAMLSYCAGHLTDGHFTNAELRLVAGRKGISVAKRLVMVGLWETYPGGYKFHDYTDFQPSSDHILAERKANRERQAKYRSTLITECNGATPSPPYPYPYPSQKEDLTTGVGDTR